MGSDIITDEYKCPICGGHMIYHQDRDERECTSCWETIKGPGHTHGNGSSTGRQGGKPGEKEKTWEERSGDRANAEIGLVKDKLSLTEPICIDTEVYFRKTLKKDLIMGRSFKTIIAALIYISCKKNHQPRPATEIADAMEVNRTSMIRTVKSLTKELRIRLDLTGPEQYAQRYCSDLGLQPNVAVTAVRIIIKARENGLDSGRDPTCIAAASVYMSSNMHHKNITQKRVSEVTGVTETTIRNRCRELEKTLSINMFAEGSLKEFQGDD